MVFQIEQKGIVPGRGLCEAPVRGGLGPAMSLHPGGNAPAVLCTYARHMKPGRCPRNGRNLSIVSRLFETFVAVGHSPKWSTHRNPPPVSLEYDELGKPRLKIGEFMGMAVSFSHVSDGIWAALSGPGQHLGIDAARAEEFEGDYPFHRAFHPEELCPPMPGVHGIRESAAMLWTVKEAAVKALGVGFGLLGPLDIRVESLEDRNTHYIPRILISCRSMRRIGLRSSPRMNVISFNHAATWVSVATRPDETRQSLAD